MGKSDQPGAGDGDAMGVGAKVAEHMFRAAEGLFGIDDPVVPEQHQQPGREGAWLGKRLKGAVKLEFTSMERVAKSSDKLAAEDAAVRAVLQLGEQHRLILANVFRTKLIGRTAKVPAEVRNAAKVSADGCGSEVASLQLLKHELM
jgi:hypothetical protein